MLRHRGKSRSKSLLQALLVTFLWSTSYVLAKIGLQRLPPLSFAAYRYIIASAALLAIAATRPRGIIPKEKEGLWKLFVLGLLGYSVAQGLQFIGLSRLPAVSVTFLLNFTPLIVVLLGAVLLQEFPSLLQLAGMALALVGAYFFFPNAVSGSELFGIIVTLLSGSGWAAYMVLNRMLLTRREAFDALSLTATTMLFGALVLFASALVVEGFVGLSLEDLVIILWMSLANTALAFVLWNSCLEQMRAFELSILQNTMLIQIAVLAWAFLGEALTSVKILAMITVFVGILMVQVRRPEAKRFS